MFTVFSTGDILLLCAFMVFAALLAVAAARSIIDHWYEKKALFTKKTVSAAAAALESLSKGKLARPDERKDQP
ncbi:MAG: hypothetical protein IJH78_02410 [Clostridia bacterium]|nr:hypothetical protein [Clostridia bacterium]